MASSRQNRERRRDRCSSIAVSSKDSCSRSRRVEAVTGALSPARGETFLDRMDSAGCALISSHTSTPEIGQRIDGRGELDRLPDSPPPMRGVAVLAGAAPAGHRAEERNGLRLRRKISPALLLKASAAGCIMAMVKRMVHLHKPGENTLRLQLGRPSPPARARVPTGSASGGR